MALGTKICYNGVFNLENYFTRNAVETGFTTVVILGSPVFVDVSIPGQWILDFELFATLMI